MERRSRGIPSTKKGEHRAVLLQETLAACELRAGVKAVDCTVGFGGHAVEILKLVGPTGRLLAMDRDAATLEKVRPRLQSVVDGFDFPADAAPCLSLHHANFASLPNVLAGAGLDRVDVVLADLGVSSMQIDDPERGFSYSRNGPLDMRMDQSKQQTAAELLATMTERDLANALIELGDEPQAAAIAAAVVRARKRTKLETTGQLVEIVLSATVDPQSGRPHGGIGVHRGNRSILARVFQALRILVNRELANLERLLAIMPDVLTPGGRAVIIAFHSGEDRLVKESFRSGARAGLYSNYATEPVRATESECYDNPRSRSAKLRWAVRAA